MKKLLLSIGVFFLLFAITIRLLYGGGEIFPDPKLKSLLTDANLELVADLPEAPGNIAVSKEGRVFITLHPEGKPSLAKVAEIKNGQIVPYPSAELQEKLYHSPQGIRIDDQNRLWTIDHGDNGINGARLVAIDLSNGSIQIDHTFSKEVAPVLSYLQDLVIDPSGNYVIIADVNFFGKKPAFVLYDIRNKRERRALENIPEVKPKDFLIQAYSGPMSRLGGLIAMKPGIDSIAIDSKSEWVYFAAMTHDRLYRIPFLKLIDESLGENELKASIEDFGPKILSDGITIDNEGNLFLTDVEHQAIAKLSKNGELVYSIQSKRFRWPDGLSWGPDGYLYIADSDIPSLVLQPKAKILEHAPFQLFRYKPGSQGRIGH
ncbi:hypothetical protein LPTSP4_19780 [Leptospira ryugenii]|uniref:Major royal jelly protein n=1 Tax=Leptospira ryugenii TaxID=1917863 RepID=A0A2P2E0P9_9LEPT|nr:L-dopachrome tautomerase-related protein [Leptospira ryugenii]GBF50453.1 hypothetical protein LPTSP4_19780 [Leptospira ryugenii]